MKHVVLSLVLIGSLAGWSQPAQAQDCAFDARPSELLLLPYFEVNLDWLDRPLRRERTTVYITNVSGGSSLVHVTFWTDLAIPTYAFDLELEAGEVLELPLHRVFDGTIPGEGAEVSPPDADIEEIADIHAGLPTDRYEGQCAARRLTDDFGFEDGRARGYITFEYEPLEFFGQADTGIVGEAVIDHRNRRYAEVESLVHLDEGQRLPAVWSARYAIGNGRTELIVWRDTSVESEPYNCDGLIEDHDFSDVAQAQVLAYDENGNSSELLMDGTGAPVPGFPAATGRYEVGVGNLDVPSDAGWIRLDLRLDEGGDDSRSWVGLRHTFASAKRRGSGTAAIVSGDCSGE